MKEKAVKLLVLGLKFWPVVVGVLLLTATWGSLLWRTGSLEERMTLIETNHLPHIQNSLNEIAQRLSNIEGRLSK